MTVQNTTPRAALIVRFIEARANRYSADRNDAVLGPILARECDAYDEMKGRASFEEASRAALSEAIEALLTVELGNA